MMKAWQCSSDEILAVLEKAMNVTNISLDDGTGIKFDLLMRDPDTLKDGADLHVITKDNGTVSGQPAIALSFTVRQTDGQIKKAQTVVTWRSLHAIHSALRGKYGDPE